MLSELLSVVVRTNIPHNYYASDFKKNSLFFRHVKVRAALCDGWKVAIHPNKQQIQHLF